MKSSDRNRLSDYVNIWLRECNASGTTIYAFGLDSHELTSVPPDQAGGSDMPESCSAQLEVASSDSSVIGVSISSNVPSLLESR